MAKPSYHIRYLFAYDVLDFETEFSYGGTKKTASYPIELSMLNFHSRFACTKKEDYFYGRGR